jgi:hypothetical protein
VNESWCFEGTCQNGDLVPTCACNEGYFGPRCTARAGLQLKALDAGGYVVCGIRMDDTLVCWGSESLSNVPSGKFSKVAVSTLMSCAVALDGSLHCWGVEAEKLSLPAGPFVDVAVRSKEQGCALEAHGTITCWGPDAKFAPPEYASGGFTRMVSGEDILCGIRADGAVFCWPGYTPFLEEDGLYRDVSLGGQFRCAVRVDGSATCSGSELLDRPLPEGRTFVWAGSLENRWCTLDTAGTLECTDSLFLEGDGFKLPGKYLSADTTPFGHQDMLCGIRDDHHVVCIGELDAPQFDLPPLE